jgi:hypothetical protein
MDVGGQSIGAQLFEVLGGKISEKPVWVLQSADASKGEITKRGIEAHLGQVADIVSRAMGEADKLGGSVAVVGIGSPGRFDENGVIRAGTNMNIGNPIANGGNEMDGVNLQMAYSETLQQKLGTAAIPQLVVHNDGNAMLSGMIDAIATQKTEPLVDQHGQAFDVAGLRSAVVADFGIGTGIGHAIARTNEKGMLDGFMTDGHASKIWIQVDAADMAFLREKVAFTNARIDRQNAEIKAVDKKMPHIAPIEEKIGANATGYVRAEDLFCAPTINALAGLTAKDVKDFGGGRRPEEYNMNKALTFAGKYMARTMLAIATQDVRDVNRANEWSPEYKAQAAQTQVYLIGGDFGGKPVGAALIAAAKAEMARDEAHYAPVSGIKMVQYKGENVAARAAATMIPAQMYQQGRDVAS